MQTDVFSTDEIIALMEGGRRVFLPVVEINDKSLLQDYDEDDLLWLDVDEENSEIVDVEYIGDEEVQCIRVEDEHHQYLTDDFIPTHNTNDIVYLKSNDDEMLKTLETLSGITHVAHRDSKTITRDTTAIFGKLTGNEGKTSYTTTVKEEPVVSFNDLASLPQRNAIMFKDGNVLWSRNEMILPMAWRLHQNNIINPEHPKYALATLPTLSSAREFAVEQFIPNFDEMLAKQMKRALYIDEAKQLHKDMFGLSDYDISRLDKEDYANEILDIVDQLIEIEHHPDRYENGYDPSNELSFDPNDSDPSFKGETEGVKKNSQTNEEQLEENERQRQMNEQFEKPCFAGGQLCRNDIIDRAGVFNRKGLDEIIIDVYNKIRPVMQNDTKNFKVSANGDLCGYDGTPYITKAFVSSSVENIINEGKAHGGTTYDFYGENSKDDPLPACYVVQKAFYRFLWDRTTWADIADGRFDEEMARRLKLGGESY